MDDNRRIFVDRRCRPTPAISRYTFRGGRRTNVRRDTDRQAVYVDRLGTGLAVILLSVFAFHVLDAFFTLAHIARGGVELNPFMDYFLQKSPTAFVLAKLSMAGGGLVFLALHARWPLVRRGIQALFVLYAGVVCYHLLLIARAGAAPWSLGG